MKVNKKKAALIGLAATTLFGAAGCGRNEEPDVYGVPIPATVTEQQNIADGVYGPPNEMMTESERTTENIERRTESDTESTTVNVEDNMPVPVYGPDIEDYVVYDYDKMSEEEIAELEDRRKDVEDILRALIQSEEFTNADVDTRIEIFYAKLEDLSVNGTEKYPEPIIKKDSWEYIEEEGDIVYEYIDGIPLYWDVTGKSEKNRQESTVEDLP